MKFTYNWLKDFIDIKISAPNLADKLTMAGIEVVSLEAKDGDFVFEIEITSNRPDWLCVIGIAREVAAITKSKINPSTTLRIDGERSRTIKKQKSRKKADSFEIEIQDKKDCPLYTGRIIRNVKVGPSPQWLKKRLELIGCRSINNVVDITNYILFTFGEPLHAFDLDKLRGKKIIVRRAKKDERLITIDATERILGPDILVIADQNHPVALAGIMGGKGTEVTEATKNILLEAAIFNPTVIRRARQKLGIQTDSSYRFERGIDLETVCFSAWQAQRLIQDVTGGEPVLAKSQGLTRLKKKKVSLDLKRAAEILGIDIPVLSVENILNNLGFKLKAQGKSKFIVEVPGFRLDINLEIDLIEELARIFGYEHIPSTLPAIKPQRIPAQTRELVSLTKNILTGLGLNEVITYSLINKDLLYGFNSQEDRVIEIMNPLSKEQEILRPTLIPSLASCVAYNLHQKEEYINIFEVAEAFFKSGLKPHEELRLAIALSGEKSLFSEQGIIKDKAGFLHLKGTLEALFSRLGIRQYSLEKQADPLIFNIIVGDEKIGVMQRLGKNILDKLDIKHKDLVATELNLDKVFKQVNLTKKFSPLPKYPGINRDISFILKDNISLEDILRAIKGEAGALLEDIKIIDYYKGKQIPAGFRGLTISCIYRSDTRTLTEAEINPLHSIVCNILTERFGAKLR